MTRVIALLLAMGLIAGCGTSGGASKDNPFQPDPEEDTSNAGGDPTTDPAPSSGVPDSLAQNTSAFTLSADRNTLTVTTKGLDTTPVNATFQRNPALDTGDYLAFTVQEDPLDRLFVALGNRSQDGSVAAFTVGEGGQFNRVQPGGQYVREGGFDKPEIGQGPGRGQVSYAGSYAGITNISYSNGAALLPVPAGTDPGLIPGEAARVVGAVFLNANFADDEVNGAITGRQLISPVDGSVLQNLDSLALIISSIDDNGEFKGEVEFEGVINRDIGDYGGIFGGTDAESVAGLVTLTDIDGAITNEIENGVFVLTQCGPNNTAGPCAIVAP